jgi:CD63 antigen
MGLGFGINIIKYLLFVFNLICALGGLALVAIGGIALNRIGHVKQVFTDNNHPGFFIGLVIVFGAVIFVISFFGCCGAIRESECCTLIYTLLLLVLVIAQIVLAAFAIIYNEDIQRVVHEGFDRLWRDKSIPINGRAIENIQQTFECCGYSSALDYGFTNIPRTCCPRDVRECNTLTYFKQGCSSRLDDLVMSSANWIAYLSLALSGIELLGVIFGCCLANSIRNSSRRLNI